MQFFVRLMAIASFLSFISYSCAGIIESVHHARRDVDGRTSSEAPRLLKRLSKIFGYDSRMDKRQNQICVNDTYAQVLAGNAAAQPFCSTLIGAPTQTVETDYTPVVTGTTITTTSTVIVSNRVHYTPTSTVITTVVTNVAKMKRQDASTTASMSLKDEVELFIRQVEDNLANATSNSSLDASMSSACSCLGVPATTTTSTYIEATSTNDLNAWEVTVATSNYTTTEPTAFTTTTYIQTGSAGLSTNLSIPGPSYSSSFSTASSTASSSSSYFSTQYPTSTLSGTSSVATAVDFSCPADNNTQAYVFEGSTQYTFTIYCETTIDGPLLFPVPSSAASTFTQCAAACAEANSQFDDVVCYGVSFVSDSTSGSMCSLMTSSQNYTYSSGSSAATLSAIAQGFAGNSTVGAPFQGIGSANTSTNATSTSLASLFSASPPVVTPPPISFAFRNGSISSTVYTSISTSVYTSGTTFVTEFSTSYSNGSWFDSYSYSYTTVYAATATSTLYTESSTSTIINGNSTGVQGSGGQSGPPNSVGSYTETQNGTVVTEEYSGNSIEYIITTTITNTTYFANGTLTSDSEAYQTIEYGSAGGGGSIASGGPSYSSTTTLSSYGPTFTSSLPASISSSVEVLVSIYSTGFSTVSIASGSPFPNSTNLAPTAVTVISSNTGSNTSLILSEAPTSSPIINSSVIVNTTSFATSSVTGFVSSGGPTVSPIVNSSVIVNTTSFATSSATSFVISGGPTPSPNISASIISVISSVVTPGVPVNATSSPIESGSNAPRAGAYSTSPTSPTTNSSSGILPSGSTISTPLNETSTLLSTPSLSPSVSINGTTTYPDTFGNRTGTYATTSATETANITVVSGSPVTVSPTLTPYVAPNSSLPGTGSSSSVPTPPSLLPYPSLNTSLSGTGTTPISSSSGSRIGTISTTPIGNSTTFPTGGAPSLTPYLPSYPLYSSFTPSIGTAPTSIVSPSSPASPGFNSTLPGTDTAPVSTGPSLTISPSSNSSLPGTGTIPGSIGSGNRTGTYSIPATGNVSLPGTGGSPSSTPVSPVSVSPSPSLNTTLPGLTSYFPTGSGAPSPPSSNSSIPGSIGNAPRTGAESTTSVPVTTPVLSNITTTPILNATSSTPVTFNVTSFPITASPSPSICSNGTMGTMTVTETTTELGCWSQCPPAYGTFSPPPALQSYGG